jgi:hypothetical protein
MICRGRVIKALAARLTPGAHVVWLDQFYPQYSGDAFAVEALIPVIRSVNHRVRLATVFRKL